MQPQRRLHLRTCSVSPPPISPSALKPFEAIAGSSQVSSFPGSVFNRMEYQIKTCHALLKWKPPHLNSVDFQLLLEQTGNGTIKTTIAYQGDHGPVKLREVMFPRAQKAEWAKNFQRVNGSIVECTYDRRAGEWR